MASDIDDDIFHYNSSQHYSDIDYQIDLFEFRHYVKSNKSKQQKSSFPISRKTLRSHSTVLREYCITPKTDKKSFNYNRHPRKSYRYECDKEFYIRTTSSKKQTYMKSNIKSKYPKLIEAENLENFSNFRRHFYRVTHQTIKSSLATCSDMKIINIRLASINSSVQNDFMKRLQKNPSYFPELVYHGTKYSNISSILDYGFLIPDEPHPTNAKAPRIVSMNGQAYGKGIYCSTTANYSLLYTKTTNTLLACAAIPPRNGSGKIVSCYGNIIVLTHVSQIIPLFLIDFKYLNGKGCNHPFFYQQTKGNQNQRMKKSVDISKQYLQKILKYVNDQKRKNNQYQIRIFDLYDS